MSERQTKTPALNIVAPDGSGRLAIDFTASGEPVMVGTLEPGRALGVIVAERGPAGVLVWLADYFRIMRFQAEAMAADAPVGDGIAHAPEATAAAE